MDLQEKTLAVTRVFEGRALTIDCATIEMPNGRRSVREIVRHRGAAVILGQRPDGLFVLIHQYRRAVESTLLEMVAGCLEVGETPEVAARREMEEESGYAVETLERIGVILPALDIRKNDSPSFMRVLHRLLGRKTLILTKT